jgi:GAF domain-containing protein
MHSGPISIGAGTLLARESQVKRHGTQGKPARRRLGNLPSAVPKQDDPARSKHTSIAQLEERLSALTLELTEARQRERATADILGVLARSAGDLDSVFQAMLKNATRICEATFGVLQLYQDGGFRIGAMHNAPAAYEKARQREPVLHPSLPLPLARVAATKELVHICDLADDAAFKERATVDLASLGGARSLLIAPLLKEHELIGTITIYRQEVRPFTEKQIALVQSFAAQAVIAIENARLLNELRESLEQQTATSEVLKVISASPGELEPVFDALLENATRLCQAKFGSLFLCTEAGFRNVAAHGAPSVHTEQWKREPALVLSEHPHVPLAQIARTKKVVHTIDLAAEPGYLERDPKMVGLVESAGARTMLNVPMIKEGDLIGAIGIYRREVRPFSDKQVELLQNFAAQAVIAIENARLLNELRRRTDDLTESLEQQTATSDVLRVISSSPGELQPVFGTLLENATRICDAEFAHLQLYDGGAFRWGATHNTPRALTEARQREPVWRPSPLTAIGRVAVTKKLLHIHDYAEEPGYKQRDPGVVNMVELAGARTVVVVPMLKEIELIGTISIFRQEVRPFTDKQIELVQNFAAQAVIAIENARLLNALRESLDRQTAAADVLGVISKSSGDLQPVFDTILENATRICEAKFGTMFRFDGEAYHLAAQFGTPPELAEMQRKRGPFRPPLEHPLGRLVLSKQVSHSADDAAEPVPGHAAKLGRARSIVRVPLLKDHALIGALVIYRQEVRPFNDTQIELLENFAAQAVIAIENARLLNELRERTAELENSYGTVREQASQLEAQAQELKQLNQQLERRVTEQVGEIERMGRLRRFLPPQVADLIVASGTEKQLESHRREITALFCDLRGFTGFSESSDPEDVMALLRDYHSAVGEIVIKYGGTLERYAGDGIMVILNDPVPVENPALQAVLMALDMRAAIGGMIEKWRDLGHDLGFGIGIAHGFATLGTIGFEGRRDYAAIGTVSNVASRLCDEAKPSQILISPRVRQAVEKAVTVEPVGEFALKGLRRPMMTYNVVGDTASGESN